VVTKKSHVECHLNLKEWNVTNTKFLRVRRRLRGVTTMLGIRKFLPGNSTCGAAPAATQVPPLGGNAASADERPFMQRKGLGCRGDAAPM